MTLGAAAFPILPGKTDDWRKFIGELNGARRQEYEASRKASGSMSGPSSSRLPWATW